MEDLTNEEIEWLNGVLSGIQLSGKADDMERVLVILRSIQRKLRGEEQ